VGLHGASDASRLVPKKKGTKMNFESFLGNIYFGSMDMERFHSFKDLEEDEKTREIVSKYLEVTKKYPPSYLEQQGTISAELLAELKKIGFFGLNIPEKYGGVASFHWLQRYCAVRR
jgi:alkylation response protein AidB-like acyl-CoA dehydrogenase